MSASSVPRGLGFLVVALVVGGLLFTLWQQHQQGSEASNQRDASKELAEGLKQLETLGRADIQPRAASFAAFVRKRSDWGSESFVSDILSMRGKWETLKAAALARKDLVPFLGSDSDQEHRKERTPYLKTRFAKHLFSEEELEDAFEQAILGFERQLTESEAAVNLAAKGDRQTEKEDSRKNTGGLNLDQASQQMQAEQLELLTQELLRKLATRVASQVITTGATSAGILTTGAGAAGPSMGTSMVLSLLADQAWAWVSDPKTDLKMEIDRALNTLATEGETVLAEELERRLQARIGQWNVSP